MTMVLSNLLVVIRRHVWDLVAIAAIIGIIYGAYEYVVLWGWAGGLLMSTLLAVAGYLSVQILYPLWVVEDIRDR
jgi:hypothetical protein